MMHIFDEIVDEAMNGVEAMEFVEQGIKLTCFYETKVVWDELKKENN